MADIFLSAGVPSGERSANFPVADPYLIAFAVRELFVAAVRQHRIVWGGHPAITPMIWAICQDLGVDYSQSVLLYQSAFFEEQFPEANAKFKNRILVPRVSGDREHSLHHMRHVMFSSHAFAHGVFIGGMEGIHDEHRFMKRLHPRAVLTAVGAPGGAAQQLVEHQAAERERDRLMTHDFGHLFRGVFVPVVEPGRES